MDANFDQRQRSKRSKPKLLRSEGAGDKKGVVYLGHLPDGFYEKEIRQYFKQFGTVRRIKVSRSTRNGKSKGYAFIQFTDNDVARIAAESTNNYLMFKKNLQAELMDPAKVHDNVFKGCSNRLIARREPLLRKRLYNKAAEPSKKAASRKLAKAKKKEKFLESLGYQLPTPELTEDVKSTSVAAKVVAADSASSVKIAPKTNTSTTKKVATSVVFKSQPAADSDDEITFKTPPNVTKTGKAPVQKSTTKRKFPKTPIPEKKSHAKQKDIVVSETSALADAPHSSSTEAQTAVGEATKSNPVSQMGANLSGKKSSKIKKTPKSVKQTALTSSTPPASTTGFNQGKLVESKRPVSDASPALPTKTSKIKKNIQLKDNQVTPEKRKSPKYSPRVTRSAAKKRKSVI